MQRLACYRHNKEYFLELQQLLFFEADDDNIYVHTMHHIYRVRYRLYELEELLPRIFMRVSKSAIVNTRLILSFSTTVGTTGKVEFYGSHKTLHISRRFIKALKIKLHERNHHETNQINF